MKEVSLFQAEANLDGHLPVMHPTFVDIAASFDHLEPAKILQCFVRPFDGALHGILDCLVEVPVSSMSL